jgi:hypothetical protein
MNMARQTTTRAIQRRRSAVGMADVVGTAAGMAGLARVRGLDPGIVMISGLS